MEEGKGGGERGGEEGGKGKGGRREGTTTENRKMRLVLYIHTHTCVSCRDGGRVWE